MMMQFKPGLLISSQGFTTLLDAKTMAIEEIIIIRFLK